MTHPSSGGRVVLDLVAAEGDAVLYDASLYTPTVLHRARARVTLVDGAVVWSDWDPGPPPAWLVDLAHAFLRGEWRARRGPDPEPWPQRINRWREEKR